MSGFDSKREAALDKLVEVTQELGLYDKPMTKDEALKLALKALESGVKTTAEQISWIEYVMNEAITAIKEALAQPAQEPVAITIIAKLGNVYSFTGDYSLRKGDKVYTAPPKRPWVGLTKDQFLEAARLAENGNYLVAFNRIQQWLKEGNT
jgi:hypothetical protein